MTVLTRAYMLDLLAEESREASDGQGEKDAKNKVTEECDGTKEWAPVTRTFGKGSWAVLKMSGRQKETTDDANALAVIGQ